jgi:hypothetical protein
VLFGVSLVFAYTALRPDMGMMRDRVPPAPAEDLRLVHPQLARPGGRGAARVPQAAVLGTRHRADLRHVMGVLSWDFVMSLEPHWFSTLIGPYFFMGAILGGVMTTALIVITLRSREGLHNWILPSTLHDLGKLASASRVLGLHVLLPVHRDLVRPAAVGAGVHHPPLRAAVPHHCAARRAVPVRHPVLRPAGRDAEADAGDLRDVRRHQPVRPLAGALPGVYPSLWIGAETLPLSWQEPGLLLLFAGLYLASIAFFLTRVPLFQVWQPPARSSCRAFPLEEERRATGDLGGVDSRPD